MSDTLSWVQLAAVLFNKDFRQIFLKNSICTENFSNVWQNRKYDNLAYLGCEVNNHFS